MEIESVARPTQREKARRNAISLTALTSFVMEGSTNAENWHLSNKIV